MQLTSAQAKTILDCASSFHNPREFQHFVLYRLHRMQQPITDTDVAKVLHEYVGVAPSNLLEAIGIICYPRLGAPMLEQTRP